MNAIKNEMRNDTQLIGSESKSPRILIVEDDKTLEPIWSYIIERVNDNAQLLWTTSEVDAEELIMDSIDQNNKFDLVIADIFLSGPQTGIDLWKRFFYLLHSRMIVTSGIEYYKFINYLGTNTRQPLYIQKPLNLHDCIEAVYGILERNEKSFYEI